MPISHNIHYRTRSVVYIWRTRTANAGRHLTYANKDVRVLKSWLSHTHVLMGALLLGFGLLTAFVPSVMHVYGLGLDEPSARVAIQAIIGGGETALGLALIFGSTVGASSYALNAMAALIFGSVGIVRLVSAYSEGILFIGSQPLREGAIELGLALLCLVAVRASKRTDKRP